MKSFISLLLAGWLMISTSVAIAANIKDHPSVAVMNFGNKAVMSRGLRDTDFSAATEYAIYQLSACNWFDLIDYEQLSTIAKMHSVNMSGLIDPATAVAVGHVVGAQFIIVGNLTGLTTKESMLGIQAGRHGGVSGKKHTVIANVAMRIVDIETGRIVVAGLGKGESASTNAEVVFKKYRRPRNGIVPISLARRIVPTYRMRLYNPAEKQNVIRTGQSYEEPIEESEIEMSDQPLTESVDDNSAPDTIASEGTYNEENYTNENSSYHGEEIPYNENMNNDSGRIYRQNDSYYDVEEYKIVIGTVEVSDVQVRNAISKAVRDCIYGNMGLMTTLNGGKKLNIRTGF